MICFLDMDGVLVDFVGGICEAHVRPSPYIPGYKGLFEIEKIWGISLDEFWEPTRTRAFWADLKPTEEAVAIYHAAAGKFGLDNLYILTSHTTHSSGDVCVLGKTEWVLKSFPLLVNKMVFTQAKGVLAGPDRILIDDKDENVVDFIKAGGQTILVPRLWNSRFAEAHASMECVTKDLKRFWRQNEQSG